jgi:hypothetical protein
MSKTRKPYNPPADPGEFWEDVLSGQYDDSPPPFKGLDDIYVNNVEVFPVIWPTICFFAGVLVCWLTIRVW